MSIGLNKKKKINNRLCDDKVGKVAAGGGVCQGKTPGETASELLRISPAGSLSVLSYSVSGMAKCVNSLCNKELT